MVIAGNQLLRRQAELDGICCQTCLLPDHAPECAVA